MDIDLLAKMVKKLILDSDRVVLPGLGCFVAEVVPASFSDRGYTINPPYRKLYFRSKPDEGDELVAFYAQTNNLPLDVADEVLRNFLSEMKSVLFIKKTVVFPGLGRLRATKENDMFFVADEGLDIYPGGFGLEPISLKSHQESREEEVSAAVSDLRSMLDEPVQKPHVSEPEPVPEPTPAPVPVSVPQPEPVSHQESVPVPEPVSVSVEQRFHQCLEGIVEKARICWSAVWGWLTDPKHRTAVLVVCGILGAVVLFFIIYAALANLFPSLLDRLLYSNEELEILNHRYE